MSTGGDKYDVAEGDPQSDWPPEPDCQHPVPARRRLAPQTDRTDVAVAWIALTLSVLGSWSVMGSSVPEWARLEPDRFDWLAPIAALCNWLLQTGHDVGAVITPFPGLIAVFLSAAGGWTTRYRIVGLVSFVVAVGTIISAGVVRILLRL